MLIIYWLHCIENKKNWYRFLLWGKMIETLEWAFDVFLSQWSWIPFRYLVLCSSSKTCPWRLDLAAVSNSIISAWRTGWLWTMAVYVGDYEYLLFFLCRSNLSKDFWLTENKTKDLNVSQIFYSFFPALYFYCLHYVAFLRHV